MNRKTFWFSGLFLVAAFVCLLVSAGTMGAPLSAHNSSKCPEGLPPNTTCYAGQDKNGAYYMIAVPANWNGILTLYTRGGPPSAPQPILTAGDLYPPAAAHLLPDGVAIATSSYRQGGWYVSTAAEDTENVRELFVDSVGAPARTIVFGASFGGMVANKVAELYGNERTSNYDGALPFCGTMAGTRRHGYAWIDLRAVYQCYCRNHPRSSEEQYPFYLGLAHRESTMTPEDLNQRVYECTGINLPVEERTEEQRHNLANILGVTRRSDQTDLEAYMFNGATLGLQNLSQVILGANAFPNWDVHYDGSDDDEALNKCVERYHSDPDAVAQLIADADPTGRVAIPIFTFHGIGDLRAFVEHESAYRDAFAEAGTLDRLFQMYTDTNGHCGFSVPEFEATFYGLLDWIDTGTRPTPEAVAQSCEQYSRKLGGPCRFNLQFVPDTWESRVYARER